MPYAARESLPRHGLSAALYVCLDLIDGGLFQSLQMSRVALHEGVPVSVGGHGESGGCVQIPDTDRLLRRPQFPAGCHGDTGSDLLALPQDEGFLGTELPDDLGDVLPSHALSLEMPRYTEYPHDILGGHGIEEFRTGLPELHLQTVLGDIEPQHPDDVAVGDDLVGTVLARDLVEEHGFALDRLGRPERFREEILQDPDAVPHARADVARAVDLELPAFGTASGTFVAQ